MLVTKVDTDILLITTTNNTMKTGVVKFFNDTKGFGFIKVDGTSDEIFVHSSGLQAPIRENDKVQFEVQEGKKGLNAVNVKHV
jgi:CspA family cold shock protein